MLSSIERGYDHIMTMGFKEILDLSHTVYHNCPGWPTYEMANVKYEAIYHVNGYTAEQIKMNVHTATHIDAPFHFFPDGKRIDGFNAESFQGEAVPVDLFDIAPNTPISAAHLDPYKDKVHPGDIVLLCTGWGLKRGFTDEYCHQWPFLSREGAEWLLERKVKGVGTDGMSIGGWGEGTGMPPHETLLKHDIWLLEELFITKQILKHDRWYLCAFPIKFLGFGGSPVRAVAMHV